MDKVRWLREALLAVDLVEEEPERELLEPEEEELGLTRCALGASASSLPGKTHTELKEHRNAPVASLQGKGMGRETGREGGNKEKNLHLFRKAILTLHIYSNSCENPIMCYTLLTE